MSTHIASIPPSRPILRAPSINKFGLRIIVPVVLATATAILAAALGLYHAAMRSDALAVERQVRETQQAISSTLDELAQNQEVVAVWDDPFLQFRKSELDIAWLDENAGVWLHDLFGHDQVYALDANDKPIYAVIDAINVEPARFAEIAENLQHLIDTLR